MTASIRDRLLALSVGSNTLLRYDQRLTRPGELWALTGRAIKQLRPRVYARQRVEHVGVRVYRLE